MAPPRSLWFRLYPEMFSDISIRSLPVNYRWLWIALLGIARTSPVPGALLDKAGDPVTDAVLADFAALRLSDIRKGREALLKLGMLTLDGDITLITNWDRRQFENDTSTRRVQLHRDKDLRSQIRERDRDRCRYCARPVNWKDRRSSEGGTYDHVDPRGANTYENVVVACRGCNAAKGSRTPDAAGMMLLPPGAAPDQPPDLVTVPEVAETTSSSSDRTEEQRTEPIESEPTTATAHPLLAPGRAPELSVELEAIIGVLVDAHGPEAVTAAEQQLLDDRRRFPWPSDARKALEAILGEPPNGSPIDSASAAQRERMERAERQRRGEFACMKCEDAGVYELDDGSFDDCDCKWAKASA